MCMPHPPPPLTLGDSAAKREELRERGDEPARDDEVRPTTVPEDAPGT